jgi:hypothetical protein
MDRLVDVKANVGQPVPGQPGSQDTVPAQQSDYGTILISFIDSDGKGFSDPNFPMNFNVVDITFGSGRIKLDRVANGAGLMNLRITIFSPNAAIEPIVEAKQHKRKRRYIVSNANPIDQVFVDNNLVYEAANLPRVGSVTPKGPALYTSLHIT